MPIEEPRYRPRRPLPFSPLRRRLGIGGAYRQCSGTRQTPAGLQADRSGNRPRVSFALRMIALPIALGGLIVFYVWAGADLLNGGWWEIPLAIIPTVFGIVIVAGLIVTYEVEVMTRDSRIEQRWLVLNRGVRRVSTPLDDVWSAVVKPIENPGADDGGMTIFAAMVRLETAAGSREEMLCWWYSPETAEAMVAEIQAWIANGSDSAGNPTSASRDLAATP